MWTLKDNFVLYISAPRGSGKTFLLVNLLISEQFYANRFDKVYIVSPSYYHDRNFESVRDSLPESQISTVYSDDWITKQIKKKKDDERILFIVDDCITEAKFKNPKATSILNTIAVNGRHMNVSLIITSQKITGISTYIRSQADGIITFALRTEAEIKALYDDNSIGGLSYSEFKALYSHATNEKYGFLYINYQDKECYRRFTRYVKLK